MKVKEKGITLVALVVTIIILLILAGVAIVTVTGDNGLFRKAREAVNTYKDAEENESQSLDYIAGQLGDLAKYDYNGYAKSTMEMTVSDGTYYLPEGFKLASDCGKTINEGIVVEDKNGNQWVWIPCYVEGGKGANAVKYNRYAFSSEGMGNQSQIELTKTDEEGNTVPDLDVDGSQKILCSSYAWDTALMFIGGEYATNSIQGNYKNVTFSYKDITGTSQTKNNGDTVLVPTGQTAAVKNIYDMGGNVGEYTSELYSSEYGFFTHRGGNYGSVTGEYPCSGRVGNSGVEYGSVAFRTTLYLK